MATAYAPSCCRNSSGSTRGVARSCPPLTCLATSSTTPGGPRRPARRWPCWSRKHREGTARPLRARLRRPQALGRPGPSADQAQPARVHSSCPGLDDVLLTGVPVEQLTSIVTVPPPPAAKVTLAAAAGPRTTWATPYPCAGLQESR